MYTILTILHVVACVFLVMVVLLQTGKGADMGAVFGGSSSTVFGSTGAGNFLTRLTTVTAVVFMLTSISLTYLSSRARTATIFDSAPVESNLPVAPAGEAPAAPPAAEPNAQAAPEANAPAAPQPNAAAAAAPEPNAAAAPAEAPAAAPQVDAQAAPPAEAPAAAPQ